MGWNAEGAPCRGMTLAVRFGPCHQFLKPSNLIRGLVQLRNGPQAPLRDARRSSALWQIEDALLNLRGETQEHEDLGDAGAGDAFASGDVGLSGDLPGVEVPLPGEGFAERLDHGRRPELPGQLGAPSPAGALGDGGDHLVGGHAARQMAKTALLEGPVGSEGHLNLLVVIGGRSV